MWKTAYLTAFVILAATVATYARDHQPPRPPADDFTIVYVTSESRGRSANIHLPPDVLFANSPTAGAAQAELKSDGYLASALRRQNVELENVIAIETAVDGGKIVYVR